MSIKDAINILIKISPVKSSQGKINTEIKRRRQPKMNYELIVNSLAEIKLEHFLTHRFLSVNTTGALRAIQMAFAGLIVASLSRDS